MMRRLATATVALMLAAICSACASQESRRAAAQWIGKDRVQLEQEMGPPRHAVPMTDSGGEELFYSYLGHHYYFQTNARGVVETAVKTD